jgi:hypothetical protein
MLGHGLDPDPDPVMSHRDWLNISAAVVSSS